MTAQENPDIGPLGGFKVKIKDDTNTYYLTSASNALGAFTDRGSKFTYTVNETDNTLTIQLTSDTSKYAGVTGKPEFAPTTEYTWKYTEKNANNEYTEVRSATAPIYYWSIVPKNGVNLIVPVDTDKGWTLEFEPA